jgi:cation:H+ antiporter
VAILANDRLIDRKNFAELSHIDGLVLISFFVIFMYYVFESMRSSPDREEEANVRPMGILKSLLFISLGIAGLIFGGEWIVDGAVAFAKKYDVSENLIGLTIVAIGTSLPELATSAIAAYKKNADIAIGNVVGSNIFNIFFVLGISSTIHPLPFQPSCNTDIAMVLFSSVLLFSFLFIGKRHLLERWQGILFLLLYIGYTAYLIYRG